MHLTKSRLQEMRISSFGGGKLLHFIPLKEIKHEKTFSSTSQFPPSYCQTLVFGMGPGVILFLGAISSSRSDVVTQFVRPFDSLALCNLFSRLVSLESVLQFECCKASKNVIGIQLESIYVPRVFQRSFMGVSRKCKECFKKASWVFQVRLQDV